MIKTARYNMWNFLPLSIIIQFTKIANVAWLCVMILNSFPQIRVNSPLVVAIVLGIIIFIGVLKEGITDYARHKLDAKVNNTPVKKIGNMDENDAKHVVDTKLMDVKVGDILYLEDKQIIPADCIVLQTTNETGAGDEGFIQTAQLDGERNLKPKLPIKKAQDQIKDFLAKKVDIEVISEGPNPNLYGFEGQLSITNKATGKKDGYGLSLPNFIPRGAIVCNCKMLGVVVYTGKDSKIILNQGHYKYKYSSIEKTMNKIFGFQLFQVFALCLIFTLCNNGFVKENENSPQYAISPDNAAGVVGFSFFSFFLMLMRLVPLDLIINTEVGKIVVSKMIEADAEMLLVDEGEMIPCRVQSMQLPEELGCVNHIFCDKTGTLTKNQLEFRGISFKGNLSQGHDYQKILQGVYAKNSIVAELLFKCFVICHDVIPMTVKGKTVMSGTSQDELIVIEVAEQSLYFTLIKRDSELIVLKDNQDGSMINIEVLKTFEFSSERKMMSVVCMMNGKQYAFVKGADTSMEPRCINLDQGDKMTLDDLDDFAEQGLRTLVYGYKEMPTMTPDQVEDLTMEDVECDMTMLGVTGVEDLLQDDVQKCIVDFKEGGCKVWILTGDKGATANQIGISCGVLSVKREIV